jgi:hypothetical protein
MLSQSWAVRSDDAGEFCGGPGGLDDAAVMLALTESVADEVVLVQPRCVMMTIAPRHLSLSVRRSGTESS